MPCNLARPIMLAPVNNIEYMGMGKCIVAPDQPNFPEILVQGELGSFF